MIVLKLKQNLLYEVPSDVSLLNLKQYTPELTKIDVIIDTNCLKEKNKLIVWGFQRRVAL